MERDVLVFRVCKSDDTMLITKRHVLSQVAKLYDPNGLLGPIIVRAKILIQSIWKLKLNWDEDLPKEIQDEWWQLRDALPIVERIQFPRWLGMTKSHKIQLHGFADASTKAYGGAIYIRAEDEQGAISTVLVISRSRVAPIKTTTIPRLELSAAELLSKMMSKVRQELECEFEKYFLWCDSMVVLHWMKKPPGVLKQYVANRVASIQNNTELRAWAHIRSSDNPADLLSRGAKPSELEDNELWLKGPKWLKEAEAEWPKSLMSSANTEQVMSECKDTNKVQSCMMVQINVGATSILERASNLCRAINITAYVLRYIRNIRKKEHEYRQDVLPTSEEKIEARNFWVRQVQMSYYRMELDYVRAKKQTFPSKSKIAALKPILSNDHLLRVGRRIGRAECSYDVRHPIIIPPQSRLAQLLMTEAHQKTKHGGVQLMMQYIRQEYWIPGLRRALRRIVHNCVTCARLDARMSEQLMGDLPEERVRPARPFLHTGVDFAGPITTIARQGRAGRQVETKSYVAVFVCLSTRAVHLDVVTSLEADAFVACFRRFVGRRGRCAKLWSDNGTTFVAADKQLRSAIKTWQSVEVQGQLNVQGTEWKFITPAAPHQGGIWEAAVKSMKYHLRRMLGHQRVTYEQLCTVLIEIEACLNSRPINAISDDAEDLSALTPGHFLIGEAIVQPLPRNEPELSKSGLRQWRKLQQITLAFWKRWQTEYLATLQQRKKWRQRSENIRAGQLVLIKGENLPPSYWAMGRVVQVKKGADGLVRSAVVRTATGELTRAVQKLCVLPVASE